MESVQRNYYAIIPANVRYDQRLSPNAKLLYGEITALCNEKGYCWARNKYFSSLYKVSDRSIKNWIKQLTSYGYIKSEIIYNQNSKEVEARYLTLPEVSPGGEKNFTRGDEKNFMGGGEKIFTDNNTVSNNTIINIKERKKEEKSPSKETADKKKTSTTFDTLIESYTSNEQLRKELKEHLKTRKQKKAALTDRALELSLKKLDELTPKDSEKIKIVQQSIMNGWVGFFPLKPDEKEKPTKYANRNIFEEMLNEEKERECITLDDSDYRNIF